jgi:hypothetical protein
MKAGGSKRCSAVAATTPRQRQAIRTTLPSIG